MHEISPLERHYKAASPGGLSGSSDPSDDKEKMWMLNEWNEV